MKAASQPSTIAMKVFLTIMAILFSTPALAHGGELFLLLFVYSTVIILYLLSSLVFIISARSGYRVKRFLLALVGFPLWVVILYIPWIFWGIWAYLRPYEYFWVIGLSILLFVVACVFYVFSRIRSKNEKRRFTIQSESL